MPACLRPSAGVARRTHAIRSTAGLSEAPSRGFACHPITAPRATPHALIPHPAWTGDPGGRRGGDSEGGRRRGRADQLRRVHQGHHRREGHKKRARQGEVALSGLSGRSAPAALCAVPAGHVGESFVCPHASASSQDAAPGPTPVAPAVTPAVTRASPPRGTRARRGQQPRPVQPAQSGHLKASLSLAALRCCASLRDAVQP